MDIKNQLDDVFRKLTKQVQEEVEKELTAFIKDKVNTIDFARLVREELKQELSQRITEINFGDETIPSSAIRFDNNSISGDVINGGIIKNFGSTGIDDKATGCQLTILDTHVVVESPILTTGLEVKGNVKIEGELIVDGHIPEHSNLFRTFVQTSTNALKAELDETFFSKYSKLVYNEVKEQGLDVGGITLNGRALVSEGELAPTIVKSNIRRLGELVELQVKGETLLDNTLFVAGKRVGINTLEPGGALAVWDEEVELVVRKKSSNTGYIGSTRDITFILGSNNKENISLDPDGSVTINDLRLGALPISTASTEPTWPGRAGEIVFNDSPAIGLPIGWVCLEGHRWANFGTIQE